MHQEYDLAKARRFLKYLARVSNRINERQKARENLDTHMTKIRKTRSNKALKKHIDELEQKINLVLEKETELISMGHKTNIENQRLSSEIERLKSQLENNEVKHHHVKKLHDSVEQLEKKMDDYIKSKNKRSEKMKELEEKMNAKFEAKKRLRKAEQRYHDLMLSSNMPEEKLVVMKRKIDLLKAKLSHA